MSQAQAVPMSPGALKDVLKFLNQTNTLKTLTNRDTSMQVSVFKGYPYYGRHDLWVIKPMYVYIADIIFTVLLRLHGHY